MSRKSDLYSPRTKLRYVTCARSLGKNSSEESTRDYCASKLRFSSQVRGGGGSSSLCFYDQLDEWFLFFSHCELFDTRSIILPIVVEENVMSN